MTNHHLLLLVALVGLTCASCKVCVEGEHKGSKGKVCVENVSREQAKEVKQSEKNVQKAEALWSAGELANEVFEGIRSKYQFLVQRLAREAEIQAIEKEALRLGTWTSFPDQRRTKLDKKLAISEIVFVAEDVNSTALNAFTEALLQK